MFINNGIKSQLLILNIFSLITLNSVNPFPLENLAVYFSRIVHPYKSQWDADASQD